jgi:hypothetical protein
MDTFGLPKTLVKWLLIPLSLAGAVAGAYAQGQVNFAARVVGVYDAPVYVCYPVKAAGDRYRVQLYAGATANPNSLAPIGDPLSFRSGAAAGYWAATAVTINTVDASGNAFAQVRVWDTANGPTYEAAVAAGFGFGFSRTLYVHPTVAPDLPATLFGLQSFTFIPPDGLDGLCEIPEPSIVLLAVLGSVPFLLRRRR